MKQFVLILILLTIQSVLLYSQTIETIGIGINSGFTYSNISGKGDFDNKYNYQMGKEIGLCLELGLYSKFNVETNLSIYQNGFLESYRNLFLVHGKPLPNSYWGIEHSYLQSNLTNSWLIGYEFGNKLRLSIQAGIYCAIYLNAKSNYRSYYYGDSTEIALINDPHIKAGYHEAIYSGPDPIAGVYMADPGLVGGIKLSYVLPSSIKINCSSLYYRGFINTIDSGRQHCNNSYNLNFGIAYIM